jgi:hypothetical protein
MGKQIKNLQSVNNILKVRNTGYNKKLEKIKENEMNRQVVCKENIHTHTHSMDPKACQNNKTCNKL